MKKKTKEPEKLEWRPFGPCPVCRCALELAVSGPQSCNLRHIQNKYRSFQMCREEQQSNDNREADYDISH